MRPLESICITIARREAVRRLAEFLWLLLLIAAGWSLLNNQNALRQQLLPLRRRPPPRRAILRRRKPSRCWKPATPALQSTLIFKAISLDPENIDILIAMSRVMALYGRNEEALQRAERAAQLAPQSVKAQAALAMAQDWYASWLQEHGRDRGGDGVLSPGDHDGQGRDRAR